MQNIVSNQLKNINNRTSIIISINMIFQFNVRTRKQNKHIQKCFVNVNSTIYPHAHSTISNITPKNILINMIFTAILRKSASK